MKKCYICQDTFKVQKCGKEGEYKGKLLCNKHYLQVKRKGVVIDDKPSRRRDERKCDICEDTFKVKQFKNEGVFQGFLLCSKHFAQARDHGEITDPFPSHMRQKRICTACGTSENVIYYSKEGIFLCRRHYDQKYTIGKILTRTKFDKNEIIEYDDYAEVILYNIKNEEVSRAKIDLDDIGLISKYKWYLGSHTYATTRIYDKNGKGRNYAMHKILTGTSSEIIDHKNRDTLDNRRVNLVLSDKSKNAINAGLRRNNSSGVTGVSFSKRTNLWRAYINYNKKRIELGWFKELNEAIKARLLAEKQYYPENPPQKHLFNEHGIEG